MLNEVIKHRRSQLRITQQKLAEKSCLSVRTIKYLENFQNVNGEKKPIRFKFNTLVELAKGLEMSAAELIRLVPGYEKIDEVIQEEMTNSQVQTLVDNLSIEELSDLKKYARWLKEKRELCL